MKRLNHRLNRLIAALRPLPLYLLTGVMVYGFIAQYGE
jgi:hypothetical protein